MRHSLTLLVAASALAASSVFAASVSYVGEQTGINTNFQNPSFPKLYDLDGNNVLGSTGYSFFGVSTSLPAFLNITQNPGNALFGGSDNSGGLQTSLIDDPASLTNVRSGLQYRGGDGNLLTLTFGANTPSLVRIGFITDNFQYWGMNSYTLTQTVGGTATATSSPTGAFDFANNKTFFFDLANVQDGDVITLSGTSGGSLAYIGGLTIDVAPIPEPTTSSVLIVALAVGLAVMRRRAVRNAAS